MTAEHANKETKQPKVQQPKAALTTETEDQLLEGQDSKFDLTPENILRLQRTIGNRELQRMMAKPEVAQISPQIIQRYQAGDEGHGGIEKRALTSVGFTAQETGQIYFGNWLRDFSQLNGSGDPMAKNDLMSLFTVIRILGWGEYNREVKPEELGTYVPSEHLDNPDAAGLHSAVPADKQTVEDPAIQALASKYPKGHPSRKPFDDAFARLSPAQQEAYNSEEARRTEITKAARTSGLPEYIERGKMHAKDKLRESIGLGRNADGFQKMGDALHAVEDYFSHSNFIDVALWTLHNEGVAAVEPYVKSMVEHMHGTNPALIAGVGPSGQPNIVTGTYSPGANDWVSRLELLKAQLHSGEFTKAFIIGLIRLGTVKLEDIAAAVGGGAGSAVGGGIGYVAGGVSGGLSGMTDGASSGASSGFDAGARSGYRSGYAAAGGGVAGEALGQAEGAFEGAVGAVGGFFSGAYHGLMGGASKGSKEGEAYGSHLGQSAGSAAGRGIVDASGALILGEAELSMLVGGPLLKAAMAPSLLIIDQIIEHYADKQTTESGVQAASRGLTGPTHSQIAKDAPDHPLFEVSARLAEEVDRQIGLAMQAAWVAHGAAAGSGTTTATTSATATPSTPMAAPTGGTTATSTATNSGTLPAGVGVAATGSTGPAVSEAEGLPVTSLVDKYVSQPASDPWWRGVLLAAIASK